MYESLAAVYDRLNYDIDYDRWAEALDKELKNIDAQTVVEVGCGTGQIALRLSKMGYRVTGVDLSPEMLQRAGENARAQGQQIRWVQQDMRELQLPRPVDAILCPCDGVNHLTQDGDLERFFASCAENLREGGLLCFDISSESKMNRLKSGELFFDVGEELAYLWRNEWEDGLIRMDLTVFVQEGERYRRMDEIQYQRIYPLEEVKRKLEERFILLDAQEVGYDREGNDKRIQYVCRKRG